LHHYMQGKIAEKMHRHPSVYLEHYKEVWTIYCQRSFFFFSFDGWSNIEVPMNILAFQLHSSHNVNFVNRASHVPKFNSKKKKNV
jgi:hypothetical protein